MSKGSKPIPKSKSAADDVILLSAGSIALRSDEGSDKRSLPDEFLIFPWGERETGQGTVILNTESAAMIRRNNRVEEGDTVPLDFEHNTVPGSKTYTNPASIAANCTLSVVTGKGLFMVPTDWTDDGEKFVGGGHYKDLSLAAKVDSRGRICQVMSAAACRQGEVVDIKLFNRDESSSQTKEETNQPDMDQDELVAAIRTALNLDDSAEPSAILEKLSAALDAPKPKPEDKVALSKDGKDDKPDEGKVITLNLSDPAQVAELRTLMGVDALAEKNDTDLRERILSRATSEGKVVPEAARSLAPDVLEAIVKELPETVPLEERGKDVVLTRQLDESNGYDADMGKQLGITEEQFKANQ